MAADRRATDGFRAGEIYDRGRPALPPASVATVIDALGISPNSRVLELGAGTGKLTAALVPLVKELIALEPSESMLSVLRRRLPAVDARLGRAEDIPLDEGTVQAVFAADAFHWFEPARATAEIARVLGPDGQLVLIWHRQLWWDRDRSPWVDEWERRLEPFWQESVRLAGAHPSVTKRWRAELEGSGLFEPLSTMEVHFVEQLSAEDFVALVASFSWLAILAADRRREALLLTRGLVDHYQPMELEYRTDVQHARLR